MAEDSIGSRIAKFRRRRGRSQKWLGAKIERSAADISHMELGRVTPSLRQLDQMAPLLKVHLLELFPGLPPEACHVADKIVALSPDRRPAAPVLFDRAMEMAEIGSNWQKGETK